jgi:hypothetical protein
MNKRKYSVYGYASTAVLLNPAENNIFRERNHCLPKSKQSIPKLDI